MKKYIILGFVLTALFANGQEISRDSVQKASVEKNLFGVQFSGSLSLTYETRLSSKVALRNEIGIGLISSVLKSNNPDIDDKTVYLIVPFFVIEPRWYYGLDRGMKLGRNIKNNSSSYVSLKTIYFSNRTPIVNFNNAKIVSNLNIIPEFGIRRVFAKHFNFEFAGGIGYQYNIFDEKDGCNCKHNKIAYDLQVSIGYNFKS